MRTVYINGEFVSEDEAKISIFDRGVLFADAVYEVSAVVNGKLIDNTGHIKRLQRSLSHLGIAEPVNDTDLVGLQNELIQKNNLTEGLLYLQVSRGVAERDFDYPENLTPSLFMFTQARQLINSAKAEQGIRVKFIEDIRWRRRDIKTTMLLAQSLAKKQATNAGFDDAWLIEGGYVNEGSSNNAFIISNDNEIITRQASNDILKGITRQAINQLAKNNQLNFVERAFSVEEAKQAKEAFSTSASSFVMPVIAMDETIIGDGRPGVLTKKLRQLYIDFVT